MIDPITGTAALLLLKGKIAAILAGKAAGAAVAAPFYVDPSSAYGAANAAATYYGPDPSQAYYAGPDQSQAYYANGGGYYGGGPNLGDAASQVAEHAVENYVRQRDDRSVRREIYQMLQLTTYYNVVSPQEADGIWADANSSGGLALRKIWMDGRRTIYRNNLA